MVNLLRRREMVQASGGSQQALYPLTDGTYAYENVTVEISNGNHVKLTYGSTLDSNHRYINLYKGTAGKDSSINSLPEWFVIPAGELAVLKLTNIVNTADRTCALNFRKANASTSGSFSTGDVALGNDITISKTLSTAFSTSCLFLFTNQNKAGTVEFDVSFVVDGVRYI